MALINCLLAVFETKESKIDKRVLYCYHINSKRFKISLSLYGMLIQLSESKPLSYEMSYFAVYFPFHLKIKVTDACFACMQDF
jgi:hypothetical protein